MAFRRGDKVTAARELGGGLFDGSYVPAGTRGVVIDVDGGFFGDGHETISRLAEEDLAPA